MKLMIFGLLLMSMTGSAADKPINDSKSQLNPAETFKVYEFKGDLEQIKYGCCRVCTVGCACGNSCISCSKNCTKGVGCACNG